MSSPLAFFLAFAIGIVAGSRTFTAPAALVWALHLEWISLDGTRLAWLHSWAAVIIFTLLALIEFVGDQLPKTPSRTKPAPLTFRIISGAFCGGAVALLGGQIVALGAILGAIGAVAGAFGGYQVRTRLVKALGMADFAVAIPEDILAIAAGFLIFSRF
jgi:uncharacterized membrane protein